MTCVLSCVDFSDVSDRVIEASAKLSQALGIELVVLHVAAPEPDFVGYGVGPQTVRDQVAGHLREHHRALDARVSALVAAGVQARALMVQGVTAAGILQHAVRLPAELVVLGSHGHSKLRELLLGSVTQEVLRHATVPVVVVPANSSP
jgi:nucleotide-binding universal stress UspA family protein